MSTIFTAQYRFPDQEPCRTGTVVAPSFNSIYQRTEYYILWDGQIKDGVMCYSEDDVVGLWEKIGTLGDVKHCLSATFEQLTELANAFGAYDLPRGKGFASCDHRWVNSGFTSIKVVCYNCGIDKP